ncbi:glycosyl transferase group 2 [Lactiplantibacillus plantarum]|nr:glycosyl transferase group 2 [Lactiplantibacillus plantarum]
MGMDQELISIIVPVYNAEKTLIRCVKSVSAQSYKNIEIILVDDGSTDESLRICKQLQSKDDRINVIHQLNAGLSSARNTGLENARGTLVAFVDSDDFINDHMYSLMHNAMIQTNADISACGRNVISETNKRYRRFCLPKQTEFVGDSALKELLLRKSIDEAAWDKLYRKSLFSGIRFPVGEINEDLLVTVKLLMKCSKVVHVGVPLYSYGFTAGSITKSGYNSSKSIVKSHLHELTEMIITQRPELKTELDVVLAEYAVNMLDPLLEKKSNLIEFREDYRFYQKTLYAYIFPFLLKSGSPRTLKVKSILMIIKIYGPLKRFKRHCFRIMKGGVNFE